MTILTSYRDKNHCFEEARDGTLDVRVRGDAIFPTSIAGRLHILCTILRQLALVASAALFSSELKQIDPDVFIVDQLSVCVPFFRLLYPKAKILFYGHYPDRLLAKGETGLRGSLKRLYRIPFDALEGWSTGCSDAIVVNSSYTRSVFKATFPSMKARDFKVIYPCVDTTQASAVQASLQGQSEKKILLSINRFEGKKALDLAITAYAKLSDEERSKARLVLAGGYDPRNQENSVTHKRLQELADSLGLKHATFRNQDTASIDMTSEDVDVLFLLSIPNEAKVRLLQTAGLLIYTPTNEHFGIVPLEAMLFGVPVLAANSGGPLETIYEGRTGWLRNPEQVEKWTEVMRKPLIPSSAETLRKMGEQGRQRVLSEFSQTKMAQTFDQEVQKLVKSDAPRPAVAPSWLLVTVGLAIFAVIGGVAMTRLTLYALSLEDGKNIASAATSKVELR